MSQIKEEVFDTPTTSTTQLFSKMERAPSASPPSNNGEVSPSPSSIPKLAAEGRNTNSNGRKGSSSGSPNNQSSNGSLDDCPRDRDSLAASPPSSPTNPTYPSLRYAHRLPSDRHNNYTTLRSKSRIGKRCYRLNLERPFNIHCEQSPLEYGDIFAPWESSVRPKPRGPVEYCPPRHLGGSVRLWKEVCRYYYCDEVVEREKGDGSSSCSSSLGGWFKLGLFGNNNGGELMVEGLEQQQQQQQLSGNDYNIGGDWRRSRNLPSSSSSTTTTAITKLQHSNNCECDDIFETYDLSHVKRRSNNYYHEKKKRMAEKVVEEEEDKKKKEGDLGELIEKINDNCQISKSDSVSAVAVVDPPEEEMATRSKLLLKGQQEEEEPGYILSIISSESSSSDHNSNNNPKTAVEKANETARLFRRSELSLRDAAEESARRQHAKLIREKNERLAKEKSELESLKSIKGPRGVSIRFTKRASFGAKRMFRSLTSSSVNSVGSSTRSLNGSIGGGGGVGLTRGGGGMYDVGGGGPAVMSSRRKLVSIQAGMIQKAKDVIDDESDDDIEENYDGEEKDDNESKKKIKNISLFIVGEYDILNDLCIDGSKRLRDSQHLSDLEVLLQNGPCPPPNRWQRKTGWGKCNPSSMYAEHPPEDFDWETYLKKDGPPPVNPNGRPVMEVKN